MAEELEISTGVCEVHRLVNNDNQIRKVAFCKMCDSWICRECWTNYPKRALAAALALR